MNPLQKAAVRRKAVYLAAIVALFTVSIFYRGLESKAADGSTHVRMPVGGEALAKRTILSQSRELELRELEEGDPEIAGEAVRLGLVGSRGLAVTLLWYAAIEKQKRNDFHEFEQLVKAVTTLQPHFITPWIFQSWNIAYNVSVEMQSLGDMYHYIARGIELLAEGERRNRRSPDMRYEIGTYYQTKFGIADQVQTLRCLYQLSCMPPDARNPDALLNPDRTTVNMEAFKKFCQDHPSFIRRLRGEERQDREKELKTVSESLRTRRPEDVVQFLRDNFNVPSRYKNATELKPAEQQFPALPPKFPDGEGEPHPRAASDELGESFSGYIAARAWFHYANTLAPPNPRDRDNNPLPAGAPEDYDQFKYRLPRRPVLILFRQGAPRAQNYQAEMMQKDGWFDAEGWDVDARSEDNPWFHEMVGGAKRRPKEPFKIGVGQPWSVKEWQAAYRMWAKHGDEYGLELSPSRLSRLKSEAGVANESDMFSVPPRPSEEQMQDPAVAARYQAIEALSYYQANRTLTNFPFYLANSRGEQLPETIEARKTLWSAEQTRRLGRAVDAAKLYKSGLLQWQKVLAANPSYHRDSRLNKVEEETCEFELDYIRLLAANDPTNEVWPEARAKYSQDHAAAAGKAGAVLPFVAGVPAPKEIPLAERDAKYLAAAEKHSPFAGVIQAGDVQAGDPRVGTPWITPQVREQVLVGQGVLKPAAPQAPMTGPDGRPLATPGAALPPGSPP